ncbi:hypothetical protein EYF80_058274 [Liparis tanakae]|uniref:Uncharacterized protein n=1 Tax=Liparis tanakae TaxID=230148 RepID=A0A4Z2ET70_9TELE|nr:hypothetical protein EYF80_058274 [Liparis tanakae]
MLNSPAQHITHQDLYQGSAATETRGANATQRKYTGPDFMDFDGGYGTAMIPRLKPVCDARGWNPEFPILACRLADNAPAPMPIPAVVGTVNRSLPLH